MKTRPIPHTDLEASELCLGTAEFGSAVEDSVSENIIKTYLDAGGNVLDTAEIYGPHTNEELVGEALSPIRDRLIVATEFGFDNEKGGLIPNIRPEHIRKVIEDL